MGVIFVTFVTNQFIVCPMCQWNDFLMSFKEWRLPNFVRSSQFKCASPSGFGENLCLVQVFENLKSSKKRVF